MYAHLGIMENLFDESLFNIVCVFFFHPLFQVQETKIQAPRKHLSITIWF